MSTPSFVGRRAVILHRPEESIDRLARQLGLLGLAVERQWSPLAADDSCDIVLVDADQGWAGLLPWEPGAARLPVVALLGSEAPGRIAWAIEQGAGAIIAKPVVPAAVYPALVLAVHAFEERRAARDQIAGLTARLRLRGLVLKAVEAIAVARQIDEEAAYRQLREVAMRRRMTLEQAAAALLARQLALPEAG
ncbi:ANTAR domain-containing response regulator [Ancylobacter lacus]|uniref:ANTAR domain-containing response regulator n=1 Tax=Ancylobacter lacus TaxID=2579970 RepID=UPI001BCBF9B1|nr:ANTAR domain-containing protein [Ancylobacter lacus]MBS7541228.1 ANTAR domain-containing protein [Ancylobacter lacus]